MGAMAELHAQIVAASLETGEVVKVKDYRDLVGCMKSAADMIESLVLELERAKRPPLICQDARIYLNVLRGHLEDPWINEKAMRTWQYNP